MKNKILLLLMILVLSMTALGACTKENPMEQDKNIDEVTKIEGKREEYIEKLDNIQKELEALPEKKDSDKGITNAMRNYFGISYEKYDEALNEIYALLREGLSPESMEALKAEQIEWIKQKEEKAREAESEFQGGTMEFVAGYISLYQSTKDRCYDLVNEYMN